MMTPKLGFLALAIAAMSLQACGNSQNDETTQTDSTITTAPPDNTSEGLPDAGSTPPPTENTQPNNTGSTPDNSVTDRNNSTNSVTDRNNATSNDVQERKYLQERHLNRDSTNPRQGVGNSR